MHMDREKRLRRGGWIFDLTKARKPFVCNCSGQEIVPGEEYYQVTIAGGGVGSFVHPYRIKVEFIEEFLRRHL